MPPGLTTDTPFYVGSPDKKNLCKVMKWKLISANSKIMYEILFWR